MLSINDHPDIRVSTHSRPKAAGYGKLSMSDAQVLFQHTAARRRLGWRGSRGAAVGSVSTHSRPKAAGFVTALWLCRTYVSTHSRPKAAGAALAVLGRVVVVSTHSRPKAAGYYFQKRISNHKVSTHSRPKAAGIFPDLKKDELFVSTHSRPKAAGEAAQKAKAQQESFNTQPPEGGWIHLTTSQGEDVQFQHTAARRRLGSKRDCRYSACMFQHTAARRRLECHLP